MSSQKRQSIDLSLRHHAAADNWTESFLIDFSFVFCVFFLYAGSSVPAINEPHYWTKAAHFWNPGFGKGDLFLESGDAHWLFFATFGLLTQWMPLSWAVWTGRFVTWLFLAAGWTMLGRSLWINESGSQETGATLPFPESRGPFGRLPRAPLIAGCWGLVWLAGLHFGHWAGEWVVGGCESKGIAYALIFAGLALAIRGRWTASWTLLGGAAAFHVVTGIWVILCVATVSLFVDCLHRHRSDKLTWMQWITMHRAGWALCLIGIFIGAVPAIAIDWGTDSVLASESAVKQVYTRLGHHLAPTRFNWIRWRDFGVQFACGVLVFYCMAKSSWNASTPAISNAIDRFCDSRIPRGVRMVIGWGMFGFGIALFGLMVDLLFGKAFPQFASKLLRFYLFRWNDVVFPLMIGAIVVSFAFGRLRFGAESELTGRNWPLFIRTVAWAYILIPGLILLGYRFEANFNERIPAGDKAHFVAKTDSEEVQVKQYRDWLLVCEWIRQNSDPESLWLTPRRQQSFKWHTGRPELACWKDAPQNAEALVEWSQRLADAYQFDKEKILQPWTTEKLWELHNKYGIRYVLLDRRVAKQIPPLLPILYPSQNELNDTFAVFEIPSQKVNVSK